MALLVCQHVLGRSLWNLITIFRCSSLPPWNFQPPDKSKNLDFFMNFLNFSLISEQSSRHHAHDSFEPALVNACHVSKFKKIETFYLHASSMIYKIISSLQQHLHKLKDLFHFSSTCTASSNTFIHTALKTVTHVYVTWSLGSYKTFFFNWANLNIVKICLISRMSPCLSPSSLQGLVKVVSYWGWA